jgi:predicted Zn-dependent protease with MMP-like domain
VNDVETIVDEVMNDLPSEYKDRLDNLVVLVDTDDPQLERCGQFRGAPLAPLFYQRAASPSEIVIFAQALLHVAGGDLARLRAVVEETVLHELGHYFGLTHMDMGSRLSC